MISQMKKLNTDCDRVIFDSVRCPEEQTTFKSTKKKILIPEQRIESLRSSLTKHYEDYRLEALKQSFQSQKSKTQLPQLQPVQHVSKKKKPGGKRLSPMKIEREALEEGQLTSSSKFLPINESPK